MTSPGNGPALLCQQIHPSVSFMLFGGCGYSNSNDKHPLLRQKDTEIEKRTYLRYDSWLKQPCEQETLHSMLTMQPISNFTFWWKGLNYRVCFGQNNWLLLVTLPDRVPMISYSILVWLPSAQWSLVDWQKPPSKAAAQRAGCTRRPIQQASPPSNTWRLPSLTELQIPRQLTSHRPFATFTVGCFFIKFWVIEQIVDSKNSWKKKKISE